MKCFKSPVRHQRRASVTAEIFAVLRVTELSHLLSRGIETSVRSQEMLASRNCIKRQVLSQSVAASSARLCDEQGTAGGSDCSNGCLLVLRESLAEILYCKNL